MRQALGVGGWRKRWGVRMKGKNTVRQGLGLNGKHSETGTGVYSETGLWLDGKHSETGTGVYSETGLWLDEKHSETGTGGGKAVGQDWG